MKSDLVLEIIAFFERSIYCNANNPVTTVKKGPKTEPIKIFLNALNGILKLKS